MITKIIAVIAMGLIINLNPCNPEKTEQREAPVPELEMPPERSVPLIAFVPEMAMVNGEFPLRKPEVTREELSAFSTKWKELSPQILAGVNGDSLAAISKWAISETKAFSLATDWLRTIPMRPMRATADGKRILFGQYKEEGFPLPSNNPIVYRRLVVSAHFDRAKQAITRVIISIGGWVEE